MRELIPIKTDFVIKGGEYTLISTLHGYNT
jgi:hypothetical protein